MSLLRKLKDAKGLEDLSDILGYKSKGLSYVLYRIPSDTKYTKFKIPKKCGGEREICAPKPELKRLQKHLANLLYACRDELDATNEKRSLSHGFRKKHSIITNAKRHKRRRYVFNLDLQDFFPSFNFGRVRGFFIHNNHFKLHEKVATIIAQIACFENGLPQGSPCSPIIADLIAHVLDVRLAQLAKQYQLRYTRYADDLTFSSNQKIFPRAVAIPTSTDSAQWKPGIDLEKIIQKAGFRVNPEKTRMQFKMSRQVVTGLTVNTKVNVRPDYYRQTRAMCDHLFRNGVYYRNLTNPVTKERDREIVESLAPIGGMLSHIHHVKDTIDNRIEKDKRDEASAFRKLYIRFLKYFYFARLASPMIICEGKTDNIYLKYAIQNLTEFHPKLGRYDGATFISNIKFFNKTGEASRLLDLNNGITSFKYFFLKNGYLKDILSYQHRIIKHPLIILVDNDNEAKINIFPTIKTNYNIKIDIHSSELFYHVVENLYLIKTPETVHDGISNIENCFDPCLLKTEINGKKFNPDKDHQADGEYGKFIFAEQVVRRNATKINFSGFSPLFKRIVAAIDDYSDRSQTTQSAKKF